jgi:hypothetical protein
MVTPGLSFLKNCNKLIDKNLQYKSITANWMRGATLLLMMLLLIYKYYIKGIIYTTLIIIVESFVIINQTLSNVQDKNIKTWV